MSYNYIIDDEIKIKYPDSEKVICSISNSTIFRVNEILDEIKSNRMSLIYAIILQPKNTKLDPLLKIGYSKSVNEFVNRRITDHQIGFGSNYNLFLYNVYPVKSKLYETMLHDLIKKENSEWNKRIAYFKQNSIVSLTIETYRLGRTILKFISDNINEIDDYINDTKEKKNILTCGDYIYINSLIDSGKNINIEKSNNKRKRNENLFIVN
jgi:hypothetical protein